MLALSVLGWFPLDALAQDTNPVVRPYDYFLRDLDDYEQAQPFYPLSLFNHEDGNFSSHYRKTISNWNRYADPTGGLTNTVKRRVLDDLEYYLDLYFLNSEAAGEYLESEPWQVVTTTTTNAPSTPGETPWWYKLNYSYTHTLYVERQAETKIELLSSGSTNTAMIRPYILTVQALDPGEIDHWGIDLENALPVPDIYITLFSRNPTNGVIITNLADNTTYEVTPEIPSTYTSNYAFNVGVQRVKVDIEPYFSGPITPLLTNVTGGVTNITGPIHYNALTNRIQGTNLGPAGPSNSPGKHYNNYAEFRAQVPDYPDLLTGWKWHRDIEGAEYYWAPGMTVVDVVEEKSFSSGSVPPGASNDNPGPTFDTNGVLVVYSDPDPDSIRKIFDHDGPTVRTAHLHGTNAPVGAILAKKFNAKQWLSWGGTNVLASDVEYYGGIVIIKKIGSNDWTRVGTNFTSSGYITNLNFTVGEAASY